MATNTPKLNLVKPETTDPVDIDVLNGNMDILDNALAPTNITTPTAGQKLVFDGTNWVNLTGYQYVDTVYYTSSGTFVKADYPWLRAIRVKVQGAGGGGGCETAGGGGGGGGGYAESFITDIAGLDASITVTRGGGGAGSTTAGTVGTAGTLSSFGSLIEAFGGAGGAFGSGGSGGATGSANLQIEGGGGAIGPRGILISGQGWGGAGGSSFLGGGASGLGPSVAAGVGLGGRIYGGGGGGGRVGGAGGAGANGIVIVELYA